MFGAVFIGISLLSWIRSRRCLPWLLSLALAFPTSAAVIAGGNGIAPFFILAGIAAMVVAHRRLSRRPVVRGPGRTALFAFLVVAATMTALGPWLFGGTKVLAARDGIDRGVLDPADLQYTVSNAAQGLYLCLGVAVVVYLAGTRHVTPKLLALGLAVGTVLSFARLVTQWVGVLWPLEFLDNSPTSSYVTGTSRGELRLRGVFSEPSELASFSLAAAAFFASMAVRSHGRQRWAWSSLVVLCCVNLWFARSGTAVVAGGALLAVAALVMIGRAIGGRGRTSWPTVTILAAAGIAWLMWTDAAVFRLAGDLVGDKLASVSYFSRSKADTFALTVFQGTIGYGAGLGSNRPSSLVPMLLSCVGVLGTAFFAAAVILLVRAAWRRDEWRPVGWAVVGLLVAKLFAGPDLSIPLLWMSLGLCARAAWTPQAQQVELSAPARTASGHTALPQGSI